MKVQEVEEVKLPKKNVKNNNNIEVNELEDIFIKEDKKPEVINIMDEDNDNDQTPNNKKDKRPLRLKPNIEPTHHDSSVIKRVDISNIKYQLKL